MEMRRPGRRRGFRKLLRGGWVRRAFCRQKKKQRCSALGSRVQLSGGTLSLPGSSTWVVGKLIFRDAHHSRVCVGGQSVIRVSSM